MSKTYKIEITLTNSKKIRLGLDTKYAPNTVEHFVKLVREDYFSGTIFHRIIENFMIQTGGYKVEENTLMEMNPVASIKGEFASNGFNNELSHDLGVISMARTSDKNSATSQFFICAAKCPWLDGEYAAFGKTIDEESNQVVLEVSQVETGNLGGGFTDFPYDLIGVETIRLIEE